MGFISTIQYSITFVYIILYTLTAVRQIECSVSVKGQHDYSGDICLEASAVNCDHFVFNIIVAIFHVVVVHRPSKLRWVSEGLDPSCWMHSSHIRPAHRGTNCKNIYHMCHCFDWVFGWVLLHVTIPYLSPYLTPNISFLPMTFSMKYRSLPSVSNWKYAAYRGTSHVPAVDDNTGK